MHKKWIVLAISFVLCSIPYSLVSAHADTPSATDAFITTWETTAPNESITIPVGGSSSTYTINWGDGTVNSNASGNQTHLYAALGNHTVSITGNFSKIALGGDSANAAKLRSIDQWGTIRWTSMDGAFDGASNMIYNATDFPDLLHVTDMSSMFKDAIAFDGDLSGWDVSSVTDMSDMFENADSFTGDLSGWNVSSVTDMSDMFMSADSFTGDLSGWDVSSVTDMSRMFWFVTNFTGDLSGWNVSSVENMNGMFDFAFNFTGDLSRWNVSSVTDMAHMFEFASKFTSDLSEWDVSRVTNMRSMFSGATVFTSDLSEWDVSRVTNMRFMLSGANAFNSDISNWNISGVTDMTSMIGINQVFTQNFGKWYIVLDTTTIDAVRGVVGYITPQTAALADPDSTYAIEPGGDSDSFRILNGNTAILWMNVKPSKALYSINITHSGGLFGTNNHRVYDIMVPSIDADSTAPTVTSIERSNPASQVTNSQTLVYRVTFSESVTGVDAADFVLSQDSTGTGSIASLTGSGGTYHVTVSATQDGTYNLDLSSGHEITDTASNPLADTAPTGADQTYTVSTVPADTTPPTISSIERHDPTSENTDSQTLIYRVTFSENVTGVDAADFALSSGSTGTGSMASLTGSGDTYRVTVSATQDGTYNLDLSSGHEITDTASNPLADTTPAGADETYTVSTVPADTTPPTVSSIERHNPAVENTDSQTLVYRVTFSENVTGVDAADFALSSGSTGGGTSTSGQFTQTRSPALAITLDNTVSDTITVPDSGTATSVSVAVNITHTWIGDLKVDLVAPDGTTKTLHDRSGGDADDIDQTYEPDFGSVSIAGTWTLRINDNYAAEDDGTLNSWTLTINHGSTASPVTTVSGSGDTYRVTVSATTDGTYNLDLASSGHGIADAASNPLADTAPIGADETYTVSIVSADTTPPTVSSIERHDPTSENTDSQTLVYRVTFSENVTGVDAADFALSSGSTGTGSIASLTGSGDTYHATVSATQDGTYNLDLSSGHGITDTASNPLADTAPTGADHTYTVSTTPADTTSPTVSSIERHNPAVENTDSQTLVYRVTFSENVTGVDAADFALSSGSTGGGTSTSGQFTQMRSPALAITLDNTVSDAITVPDSGTATSVSVAVNITHTWIGDLKVDLVAPDGTTKTLHDRSGGDADDIDQTYEPDFGSVSIAGTWTLRVNDNYAAEDDGVLNSWTLTINHGSPASPAITVSGSGDQYLVTVSATQDGMYNLDLSSGHGITDTASNPLADTTPTGADETYTVSTTPADTTPPAVSSIERHSPTSQNTTSQTLVYRVTFSENVTGVDAADFALSSGSTGGGTSTSGQFTQTRSPALAITLDNTVSDTITVPDSGTATSVSVAVDVTHAYRGDLKIDLIAPDGTTKILHSQSFDSTDDIDQTYEPDFGGVSSAGTWTLRINDNYAAADDGTLNSWTLTINHGSSSTASPVTTVSGSGDTYRVTVSATTDGTYNLDLASFGHGIADAAANPLADTTPTGADETYTVSTVPADTTPPAVSSIERHSPTSQNTASQTLVYRVTFNEDVTGVNTGDFALSPDSPGAGSIAGLAGSGSSYHVTVSATQNGTYNLDLVSSGHGITDTPGNPLNDTSPTGEDQSYTVTILNVIPNSMPSVDAGSDQTVQENSAVTLNGTASDADDDPLTYLWSHDSDLTIALSDAASLSASFTAPQVDSDTTITFTLAAYDETSNATDTTSVTITDSTPPVVPDAPRSIGSVTLASTVPGVVEASWGAPAEEPGDYRIAWAKVGEGFRTWTDLTVNAFPTTTSHTITDLEEGAEYKVMVRARYDGGLGDWSDQYTVTVKAPTQDTTDPTITITGANPISVTTGTTYSDPGATCTDGTDASPTLSTTSDVDVQTAGTYQVTYICTDSSSNTATATRDVVVADAPDTTDPTVSSIERHIPTGQNTGSQTLVYQVTFSEDVTGVDAGDFVLSPDSTGTGGASWQFVQTSEPAIPIPDRSTIQDSIAVEQSGTATSVSVAVNITHSYIGDLKVDLIAPDGTTRTLHDSTGYETDDIDQTYAPDFGDVGIEGDWTLRVRDSAGGDTGTLNGWTLTINHGSTAGTANPVTSVSGSGDTYHVTVSASTDGTYNLDLVSSGHGIVDEASNQLEDTTPTGSDHTYTVSTAI